VLFEERPLNKPEQLHAFQLRSALSQLRRLTDPMRTVMIDIVESPPQGRKVKAERNTAAGRHWMMLSEQHGRVANAADALREAAQREVAQAGVLGGPDPVLAAVGIPGGDLTLQTSRQVLLMAPRFGPGPLREPARRIPQGGALSTLELDKRSRWSCRGRRSLHRSPCHPSVGHAQCAVIVGQTALFHLGFGSRRHNGKPLLP